MSLNKCQIFAVMLLVGSALPEAAHPQNSVINSPHNLSASGPGNVKSLSTRQVCVFCHAPHSVNPESPLWNRDDTGQTYTQYSSSTLVSDPGQPVGSSRLCLACHDGTVALERINVMPSGAKSLGLQKHVEGRSNLGTDLADDHPISFVYDAGLAASNGRLANPGSVQLPMDGGMMACETCHDPHDNTWPPFLNLPSESGTVCTVCHMQAGAGWSWQSSSHATSTARPRGSQPWRERKPQWKGKDVGENACFNCHAPHNASTPARLIVDREEQTCYRCHDGTVADSDVQADQLKISRHPVEITPNLDHDAARVENPLRMNLHVECDDCHNPHAVEGDDPMITVDSNLQSGKSGSLQAPRVNSLIKGVSGLTSSGLFTEESNFQYEVCFKCHGVPGRSSCGNRRCTTADSINHERVDRTYNLRDKLDPDSNPGLVSYHPVVRNNPFNDDTDMSLRRELGLEPSKTMIYCTDCHNSDQSSAGTGSGAEGPHGSIYAPILSNSYTLNTRYSGLASAGKESALCFKCHDESRLRNDVGTGKFSHRSHEDYGTCVTCHDPHGSARFKHLLNFGTVNNLVPPGDSPLIRGAGPYSEPTWIETPEGGECWLQCHTGGEHLGASYPAGLQNSIDSNSVQTPWPD